MPNMPLVVIAVLIVRVASQRICEELNVHQVFDDPAQRLPPIAPAQSADSSSGIDARRRPP